MALGLKIQIENKEMIKQEYFNFVKELEAKKLNLNINLNNNDISKIFEGQMSSVNKSIEKSQNDIIQKYKTANEQIEQTLKDRNNKIEQLKNKLNDLTKKDMDNTYNDLKRFAELKVMNFGMNEGMQQVKDAVNYVKNMDSALIDLSKVVDMSNSSLDNMRLTSISLGNELAKSSVDIAKSMSVFGAYTKDVGEISELAKTATMASNVTDLSASESAKAITSTMVAFKMNAKDSMQILNSWNNLQNNFLVRATDLSESIAKVGTIAKQTGTDFNYLNGITTTLVSSLNISGSEAGTAIKSMMSRLYNMGEGDGGKAQKILKEYGIEVVDAMGKLKPLNDIVNELNTTFQHLTESQKVQIEQAIGGTYHYSKVATLIDQVDKTTKAYNTSLNSQGSALQENQKYVESVVGQWQLFKNKLETIYSQTLNSDILKGFIGILKSGADAVGFMTNKFGGLNTILATTFASMSLFKKDLSLLSFSTDKKNGGLESFGIIPNIVKGAIASFKSWGTEWDNLNKKAMYLNGEFNTMPSTLTRVGNGFKSLATVIGASEIAMAGLSMAINFGLTLGIGFLVGKAMEGIDNLIHKEDNLKKANAEVLDSYKQATKAIADNMDYLNGEGKEYDTLKNKITLNKVEQEKLSNIKEKLANMAPEFIRGFDNEGKIILDNTKNISDYVQALKEKNKIEQATLLNNGKKSLEESQIAIGKSNKTKGSLESELANLDSTIIDIKNKLKDRSAEELATQNGLELINKLKKAEVDRTNTLNKLKTEESNVNAEMSKMSPLISAIINNYDGLNDSTKKVLQNMVKITPDMLLDVGKGDFTQLTVKINDMIQSLTKSGNLEKIQVLMDIKKPKDNDIKNYIDLIAKIAQETGKTPLELTKMFPLQVDNKKIKQIIDNMIKDIQTQLSKETDEKDKVNLTNMVTGLKDFKLKIDVEGSEKVDNATDSMTSLKDIEISTTKAIQGVKGEMKEINQVLDEHAKSGEWNSEIMDKLLDKYPDLIQYLGDDKAMTNALTNIKNDLNKTAFDRMDKEISAIAEILNGYGIEVSAYADKESAKTAIAKTSSKERLDILSKEMGAMNSEMDTLSEKYKSGTITPEENQRYNALVLGGMRQGNLIANAQAEIDKIGTNIDKYFDLQALKSKLGNFSKSIGDKDYDGRKNTEPKAKKSKEDVSDIQVKIDINKDYEIQLNKVNNALSNNKETEEDLIGNELINKKKEDLEYLRQKATLQDYINENNKKALGASSGLLGKFGFNIDANGNILNRNERLLELQAETNKMTGEQKKTHVEILKQIEQELGVHDGLNQAITKYNQEHKQTENEALKVRETIRDTVIELNNVPIKNLNKDAKELQDTLSNISINENESTDRQIYKLNTKEELNKKLLDNTTEEGKIILKNITYLQEELKTTKENTVEHDNILKKIDEQKDKYNELSKSANNYNKALKDLAVQELDKRMELIIYNGKTQKEWEKSNKDNIESIELEISELQKKWDKQKEEEERSNKLKDIADLQSKIRLMDLETLKNLSEEEANRLGVEEDRKRVLEQENWLKEKQLELENLKSQKNVQELTKNEDNTYNFKYVSNQSEIDKISKEITAKQGDLSKDLVKKKDDLLKQLEQKETEYQKWLIENDRRAILERLNQQKQHYEEDSRVRQEFFENWKEIDKTELLEGKDGNLYSIYNNAMNAMSLKSKTTGKSILDSITNSVKDSKEQIDSLIKKINSIGTTDFTMNPSVNFVEETGDEHSYNKNSMNNNVQPTSNSNKTGTWFDELNGDLDHDTPIINSHSIGQFAEGGNTGNFEGGKLAVLHKNEIVNNEVDSSKLLEASKLLNNMDFQGLNNNLIKVSKDFIGGMIERTIPNLTSVSNTLPQITRNIGNAYNIAKVELRCDNLKDGDSLAKIESVLNNTFGESLPSRLPQYAGNIANQVNI